MRLRPLSSGLFVLSACLSVPGLADDADNGRQIGERPSYAACVRGSGGITASILNCDGQEQKYQDHRINVAYRTLMTTVPASQRQGLRQQERTWIKDRDIKCAQPGESGTAGDVNYSSCFLDETARQATKLENMTGKPKP